MCCADGEAARALAGKYIERGVKAKGYTCDFSQLDSLPAVPRQVAEDFGRVDCLVTCGAGIEEGHRAAPMHTISLQAFKSETDAGIKGLFRISKYSLREILKTGGSIVHIISFCGITPVGGHAPLVAISGATVGMTRMMAAEIEGGRARVNAVAAGLADGSDYNVSHQPVKRPVRPADIAAAVRFLASSEASYITGVVLPVDGGLGAGYIRSF